MKQVRMLSVLLLLLVCFACQKSQKTYDIIWQGTEIRYTAPMFYMNSTKWESEVRFVYEIKIKNTHKDTLIINLYDKVSEVYKEAHTKLPYYLMIPKNTDYFEVESKIIDYDLGGLIIIVVLYHLFLW
jgi:hypothetical protein